MLKLIFLYLLSLSVHAIATLEDYNPSAPKITMYGTSATLVESGVENDLFVDSRASTSNSESDPITVYIPIANPQGTTSNLNYTYYSTNGDATSELNFLNFTGTTYYGKIRFNFNAVLNGETNQYVHLAYQDDNGAWQVITGSSSGGGPESISSNYGFTHDFSFEQMCSQTDNNSDFDCSNSLANNVASPSATDELMIFAFFDNGAQSGEINPSEYNGVYYKLKFSNKIISTVGLFLNNLIKGDTKLFASIVGFEFSDDIRQTYVYLDDFSSSSDEEATSVNASKTMKDLSLTLSSLTDINSTTTSGTITIPNLTNDVRYAVRFVFCDKYGFCSRLSNLKANTPESLESLLKKQACYLLTAGFEGENKVIDFFRVFRDKVMSRFFAGQAFTQLYYNTAPHFTGHISKRPWLKSVIRIIATVLYGVFKYWWISLTLFVSMIIFLAMIRSRREEYGRP